jgi:hypothetical protein
MISQEIVRELLDYNTETGKLTWRERNRRWFKSDQDCKTWNTRFARKEAFIFIDDVGYHRSSILGKDYRAHRVIWLWMTGEWPEEQIDHINHNRKDNRWRNIRKASNQENSSNQSQRNDNTSGQRGVYWDKRRQKWSARIWFNKKSISLGYHCLYDDAVRARKVGEKEYNFHENHGIS